MSKKFPLINLYLEKEKASNRHYHTHQSQLSDHSFEGGSGMDDSDAIPHHLIEESKRNQPDVDNLNYE